ncbi:MAG TPA: zf-HC2 domain-containing protein [Ktedonobacterales bacterium]|nr:zf-HC2 domain-containing protein [Ktedonobacterales bacterium]
MQCAELVAYLSSYIDNELDAELAAVAREHLATCSNCQIVLDSTLHTIALGKGQRARVIPAAQRAALFARIQAALAARDDDV